MSVEAASAWAEWMTQKFGRGARILSGWGVFEVIRSDRLRLCLSAAFSFCSRGAHKAPLLCVNISPLILVTLCLRPRLLAPCRGPLFLRSRIDALAEGHRGVGGNLRRRCERPQGIVPEALAWLWGALPTPIPQGLAL